MCLLNATKYKVLYNQLGSCGFREGTGSSQSAEAQASSNSQPTGLHRFLLLSEKMNAAKEHQKILAVPILLGQLNQYLTVIGKEDGLHLVHWSTGCEIITCTVRSR